MRNQPLKKSSEKRQRKALGRTPEPHVGIFRLTNGKLLIDSTLLSKAQQYDHFRIHSGDHISDWTKFQQQGISPMDVEYEEHPRGRVIYNTKTQLFTLLADQCILSDKGIISIMSALKLPRNIEKDGDGHYRCLTRLRSKFGRKGQEGWFRHRRVGPGNFTPSRSQIPDMTLSRHPARAVHERPSPSVQA